MLLGGKADEDEIKGERQLRGKTPASLLIISHSGLISSHVCQWGVVVVWEGNLWHVDVIS